MDIKKGTIVRSAAGHDKNGFFVVFEAYEDYAIICDGKRRSIEKMKKKKIKHLFPTNIVIPSEYMQTNRQVRKALSSFNNKANVGKCCPE